MKKSINYRHTPNGPAFEWADGDWAWWLNNRRHRYYGPHCYFKETLYDEWRIHEKLVKRELR